MIVVDVNAIAYLWIPGEMSECAEKVLFRDPVWIAPMLWRSEFRNILAGYMRKNLMTRDAARRCIDGAESHMSGNEYILPSSLVMLNVATSKCSAYDCEYVALASDLSVRLVTLDRQILREFPGIAVSMQDFVKGG